MGKKSKNKGNSVIVSSQCKPKVDEPIIIDEEKSKEENKNSVLTTTAMTIPKTEQSMPSMIIKKVPIETTGSNNITGRQETPNSTDKRNEMMKNEPILDIEKPDNMIPPKDSSGISNQINEQNSNSIENGDQKNAMKKRKRHRKKTKCSTVVDENKDNETVSCPEKEVNGEISAQTSNLTTSNATSKKRKRNKNKNKGSTETGNSVFDESKTVNSEMKEQLAIEKSEATVESPPEIQKDYRKIKAKKRVDSKKSILDELQEKQEREQQEARINLKNEIAKREKLLEKIDMVLDCKKSEAKAAQSQQESLRDLSSLTLQSGTSKTNEEQVESHEISNRIEKVLDVTKLEIKNVRNQQAFVGRLEHELAKVREAKDKYLSGEMAEPSTSQQPKLPKHIEKLSREIKDIKDVKPRKKEDLIKEIESRDLLMAEISKVLDTTKNEIEKVQKQQKIISNLETELFKRKEAETNEKLLEMEKNLGDENVHEEIPTSKPPSGSESLLNALMANVGKIKEAQAMKQQKKTENVKPLQGAIQSENLEANEMNYSETKLDPTKIKKEDLHQKISGITSNKDEIKNNKKVRENDSANNELTEQQITNIEKPQEANKKLNDVKKNQKQSKRGFSKETPKGDEEHNIYVVEQTSPKTESQVTLVKPSKVIDQVNIEPQKAADKIKDIAESTKTREAKPELEKIISPKTNDSDISSDSALLDQSLCTDIKFDQKPKKIDVLDTIGLIKSEVKNDEQKISLVIDPKAKAFPEKKAHEAVKPKNMGANLENVIGQNLNSVKNLKKDQTKNKRENQTKKNFEKTLEAISIPDSVNLTSTAETWGKPSMAEILKNAPDPQGIEEISETTISEQAPTALPELNLNESVDIVIETMVDSKVIEDPHPKTSGILTKNSDTTPETVITDSTVSKLNESIKTDDSIVIVGKTDYPETSSEFGTNIDSKNVEGSGFASPVRQNDVKPLKVEEKVSSERKKPETKKTTPNSKSKAYLNKVAKKPDSTSKPRSAPSKIIEVKKPVSQKLACENLETSDSTIEPTPLSITNETVITSEPSSSKTPTEVISNSDQIQNVSTKPLSSENLKAASKSELIKNGSKTSSPSPQKAGNVNPPAIYKPKTPSPPKPVVTKSATNTSSHSPQNVTAKPSASKPANTKSDANKTETKTPMKKTSGTKSTTKSKTATIAEAVNNKKQ